MDKSSFTLALESICSTKLGQSCGVFHVDSLSLADLSLMNL